MEHAQRLGKGMNLFAAPDSLCAAALRAGQLVSTWGLAAESRGHLKRNPAAKMSEATQLAAAPGRMQKSH